MKDFVKDLGKKLEGPLFHLFGDLWAFCKVGGFSNVLQCKLSSSLFLSTTKLRFTGRMNPGKIFPGQLMLSWIQMRLKGDISSLSIFIYLCGYAKVGHIYQI
jgi:hypothetical protein